MPCQCIAQPVCNSTKTILNSILSLENRKLDPYKLLDDVFQNDTLMKYVNQKAALKVSIPFCKKQYQDLINIDLNYSANEAQ